MSYRRHLLILLGAAAVAPRKLFAQAKQPVLIGWLHGVSRQPAREAAFRQGMAELGWKEGVSFVLEERWADGRSERLQPLAEELAAKKPALIVAGPNSAVAAAAKAAPKTPIVVIGGDPLGAGLVSNLAARRDDYRRHQYRFASQRKAPRVATGYGSEAAACRVSRRSQN